MIYVKTRIRGGPFDFFFGGGGWKISKKNFLQSKEKENKIMQHTIEKKYHAKESAQKIKFLHVNLLTFFTSVLSPQACKILHF